MNLSWTKFFFQLNMLKRRYNGDLKRKSRTLVHKNREVKWYDNFLVNGPIVSPTNAVGGLSNPGDEFTLNTVIQGDTASDRDGREIAMLSLEIHGIIFIPRINSTLPGGAPVFMVAIVLDTQCNGANLLSENVFVNYTGSAIAATSVLANMETSPRYQVLKRIELNSLDRSLVYESNDNIRSNSQSIKFSCYYDLEGLKCNYKEGVDENIDLIVNNSLNVICFGTSSVDSPTLSYNSRLRFVG